MQRYSMLIQWTGESFIVTFPEFPGRTTQGSGWQDAAKNGEELLGQIIESGEQPAARDARFEVLEKMRRDIEELGKDLRDL